MTIHVVRLAVLNREKKKVILFAAAIHNCLLPRLREVTELKSPSSLRRFQKFLNVSVAMLHFFFVHNVSVHAVHKHCQRKLIKPREAQCFNTEPMWVKYFRGTSVDEKLGNTVTANHLQREEQTSKHRSPSSFNVKHYSRVPSRTPFLYSCSLGISIHKVSETQPWRKL